MKIIGSGFGRTGTLSLKKALEQLGFGPCYHMETVIRWPKHIRLWHDVAMGKPVDWSDIFSQYQATVDYPASVYYKEMLAAYPDAKVIHTARDPERWYNSTLDTIYQAPHVFPRWVPQLIWPLRLWLEMQETIIWQKVFNGRFSNRKQAIAIFNDYIAAVQRTVPTEQLLVFNVEEGWEPLCRFLQVPVPNTPFPRVNGRKAMQRRLQAIRFAVQWGPALAGALAVFGLIALWLLA